MEDAFSKWVGTSGSRVQSKHAPTLVALNVTQDVSTYAGPSPGFRSRGAKNRKGGAHFKKKILDVCSNWGAKHKIGVTDFK